MLPTIFKIHFSGKVEQAQLQGLLQALGNFQITILDLNQAVVHENMSLALLVSLPNKNQQKAILKEILFQAHNLGLRLNFEPIDPQKYLSWLKEQADKQYIITLLGHEISTSLLASISKLAWKNDLKITLINRLSKLRPLEKEPKSIICLEFILKGQVTDMAKVRSSCLSISQQFGVDIGIQEDTQFRKHRRLIAFDMDSTLIQAEVIDELAKLAGKGPEITAITHQAMEGKIDFKQSLSKRVSLLQGLPEEILHQVALDLPLTDGAERLIKNLKTLGYKIAIISGGFTFFGHYLQEKLGIDYVFANELEIENGYLTGRVKGEIIDGQRKAALLQWLAEELRVSLEQVIAVGDGANDLPMLGLAGLGIAFRGKPVVRKGAKQALSNVGLDAILYFIGLKDREVLA